MCGRFTLSSTPEALREQFALEWDVVPPPRYNIAPTQPVTAIWQASSTSGRAAAVLNWGLIPSWAKDPSIGSRMINARAETITEKPSFRNAFRRRRCLVPASGYYEWIKRPDGSKQPYLIRMNDNHPFAMAGLWEHWIGQDGSEIQSCTLITTDANEELRALHHRMPVILPREEHAAWLETDERNARELLPLLKPLFPGQLGAHPVSTLVNNPRNDVAECLAPIELPAT